MLLLPVGSETASSLGEADYFSFPAICLQHAEIFMNSTKEAACRVLDPSSKKADC